jgi:uncharacterized protein YraI
MKTSFSRWIGIGAIALALPLTAAAQQAFTRGSLNLRAGPASNYPIVATLAPGQPVNVVGCTNGYGWCDVVLPDGLRGWVYAPSLDYAYEDRRVPLASYGAAIGIPIIGFAIGNYWSSYYRDRPWYGNQRWWGNRPPPPRAGWQPGPMARPDWRPNPWQGPGFGPRPGPRPHGPNFGPGPNRPPMQGHGPGPGFRPQQFNGQPHGFGGRGPGGPGGHGGPGGGHGGGGGRGGGGGHGGGHGGGGHHR